jgi:hypothetical protein
MKLVQSMDRLQGAARSLLPTFVALCDKLEKVVDSTLTQQKELQRSCTFEELWEGEHLAQPSIAEMLEWIYDSQVELRKESGLREHLMQKLSHDSLQSCSSLLDLWQASTFFDVERYRARSDAVKIHGSLTTSK